MFILSCIVSLHEYQGHEEDTLINIPSFAQIYEENKTEIMELPDFDAGVEKMCTSSNLVIY